jgi:hypothetical protein
MSILEIKPSSSSFYHWEKLHRKDNNTSRIELSVLMTTFHSTKNCKLEHIKKELATALRTIITMNAMSLSEQSQENGS